MSTPRTSAGSSSRAMSSRSRSRTASPSGDPPLVGRTVGCGSRRESLVSAGRPGRSASFTTTLIGRESRTRSTFTAVPGAVAAIRRISSSFDVTGSPSTAVIKS